MCEAHTYSKDLAIEHNMFKVLASDMLELLNENHSNQAQQSNKS